jgi:N-acetylglucosamine kinase-like BadF-type ATPase
VRHRRLLGVDSGGTRTRALLTDGEGRALGEGSGPSGLLDPGDPSGSAAAIELACRQASERARIRLPVDALWAGVAGAGREEARVVLEQALEEKGLARSVRVGTDVEAAFHDVFGADAPGILLVAGTGSIAMARGPDGETARCGGWGTLLGDEGSGYRIALDGLRAVCRADDGRDRPTILTRLLLGASGVLGPSGLVPWMARAEKAEVAELAPLVIRSAEAGDPVAVRILDDAVTELIRQAEVAAFRVGYRPPFEVALTGGLTAEGGPLRERLSGALGRHGFGVRPETVIPARGAAALAALLDGGAPGGGGG